MKAFGKASGAPTPVVVGFSSQETVLRFYLPLFITGIACMSAAAGVWLTSLHAWSKRLVPFSGGILIGVAIFWVLPEMADALLMNALVWIAAGFAALVGGRSLSSIRCAQPAPILTITISVPPSCTVSHLRF